MRNNVRLLKGLAANLMMSDISMFRLKVCRSLMLWSGRPMIGRGEKQCVAFHADAVQRLTRRDSWTNVGTFEPFIPVALVIDNPTVDVFFP